MRPMAQSSTTEVIRPDPRDAGTEGLYRGKPGGMQSHMEGIGMRVFCAAAMFVWLVAPACAQEHMQEAGQAAKEKSQTQIQSDRDAERAYKRSLNNIPDAGPSDPWGQVRSESPSKPVAKAVAKGPTKRIKAGAAD